MLILSASALLNLKMAQYRRGTTKAKDQTVVLMKSRAGLQKGPKNSIPLGPSGARKLFRLYLIFYYSNPSSFLFYPEIYSNPNSSSSPFPIFNFKSSFDPTFSPVMINNPNFDLKSCSLPTQRRNVRLFCGSMIPIVALAKL